MFQVYLCLELSSTQTVYSHYIPSFLHISKMMMNVMTTLQPTAKYSTFLSLLFSTPLLLLFFSTILLLLLPLFVFTPLHFLFPCYSLQFFNCTHTTMNSKTSKLCTTSNNKHKLLLMVTPFLLILEHPTHRIHFFICLPSFN